MKSVGGSYTLKAPEKMICHGCEDLTKCEYNLKECYMERRIENYGRYINYSCAKF